MRNGCCKCDSEFHRKYKYLIRLHVGGKDGVDNGVLGRGRHEINEDVEIVLFKKPLTSRNPDPGKIGSQIWSGCVLVTSLPTGGLKQDHALHSQT